MDGQNVTQWIWGEWCLRWAQSVVLTEICSKYAPRVPSLLAIPYTIQRWQVSHRHQYTCNYDYYWWQNLLTSASWERDMSTKVLAAGCTTSNSFMMVAPSLEIVVLPVRACVYGWQCECECVHVWEWVHVFMGECESMWVYCVCVFVGSCLTTKVFL